MFEKIKGQRKAINQLKFVIQNDKVSQSYLFYGPAGVGKLVTAFEFAKTVNCKESGEKRPCNSCSNCRKINNLVHPDVEFIYPTPKFEITADGGFKKDSEMEKVQSFIEQFKQTPYDRYKFSKATSIQIDTIRRIERKIQFAPREGNFRVIIIAEADKMNTQAENAFLKTLEEPPDYTIIILTTTRISFLLPTLVSRCQRVRFNPIVTEVIENYLQEEYDTDLLTAKISARISNGSIAKATLISLQKNVEARSMSLSFIKYLLNNDLEQLYEFSENFRFNKNDQLLRDIFYFLILWFGDIIYLKSNQKNILNIDQKDKLENFQKNFHISNKIVREIIDLIEERKSLLFGHVNFELIAIDTFFQIRKKMLNEI